MATSGKVNIDVVNDLLTRAQELRDSLSWYETDPFSKSAGSLQAMADALGLMANLQNLSQRDNLLFAETDEGQKFREVIDILTARNQKLVAEKAKVDSVVASQDAQTVAVNRTNTSVQTMIGSYNQLLSSVQASAQAQATMANTKPTGRGVISNPYFAAGGMARGTDTIPAMLSAGERVTDAKNSRRFFSQLQAIGAGQQPVYRNAGGDTYNTNVGDINVQDTSGRPNQTAREVMRQIQREQRRGSGRI
jgi:hypothetical protein